MCGRYYRRSDKQRIADAFRLGQLPEGFVLPPDFNVAPTTTQLADFKGFSTINAKAETVASRALWRGPFERRRCLVPADGFYEWKRLDSKTKQPYAFGLKDAVPFAFAGLWDAWKDPANGDWLQTFSIITTDPNEVTAIVKWNRA